MREVEVARFVAATPAEVERALAPASVVEYEGSFAVLDVEEADDATYVTAGGGGIGVTLRFEPLEDSTEAGAPAEDGYYYEQEGDEGPFDEMWTRLRWTPEDEGTRVSARSGVSLGLPLAAVTDRVAAWKRRGELRRALDRVATDLE